jgi:Protein of unknown function (DUF433)
VRARRARIGDTPAAGRRCWRGSRPPVNAPAWLPGRNAATLLAGCGGALGNRRGVHASAPVFAGTRIRIATVQRYLQQGYETDAILNAFPDLRVEDVDEARRQLAAAG